MLRGKKSRKSIAAGFFLLFLSNLLAPNFAYALTSGPTSPDATSFEPVDTTDMVNLQTGDFTYNIPLLEVPGPEGGYPLSLAYHAGIDPNLDASWVGLGWTLNPGAINRSVNGYPDDWMGEQQTRRDYWNGGETYTIGVDVGFALAAANASFGLSVAFDTYKGFGFGLSAGISIGLGAASLNAKIGVDPYGEPFARIGLSAPLKGTPLSTSIGIAQNFNSISFSGGFSMHVGASGVVDRYGNFDRRLAGEDALGVSVSSGSGKTKASLTAGGMSGEIYNSNAGKIQTDSWSFGFVIGIGISVSYYRYWSDESVTTKTYGTMFDDYYGGGMNTNYDDIAFDTYSLQETNSNLVDNNDPYKQAGGAYPDVDFYSVTAQGLGGNIRPYHYQRHVLSQNRKDNNGNYLIKYYNKNPTLFSHGKASYRFVNDFSNRYTQTENDWNTSNLNAIPFDASPVSGAQEPTYNELAGSKVVNWYDAIQIQNGTAKSKGFVDNQSDGFVRPDVNDPANATLKYQVSAFSIINESGVTYHYALPVYSKNEKTYTEKINTSFADGHSDRWNTLTRPSKYAYTWLLTSVTGPDFVDRNSNGYADAGDWGYWVNFSYGKWTDAYKWRNPVVGFQRDVDNNFQSNSEGEKEVYYLNKIVTRTHTAIFEKDLRYDGKSSYPNITNSGGVRIYNNNGRIDQYSEGALRLDRIFLLKNEDATSISASASTTLNKAAANNMTSTTAAYLYNFAGHLASNVIDKYDIDPIRTTITSKAIRVIEFNYDYSLCPRTVTSFDYPTPSTKTGKLTLSSVAYKGKGGVSVTPPTSFYYDLTAAEQNPALLGMQITDISKGSGTILTSNSLVKGDLVTFQFNSTNYYAVITDPNKFKLLNSTGLAQTNYNVTVSKTKNPEYNLSAYDEWHMFKPDYDGTIPWQKENQRRTTTPASSECNDVWSLRRIVSPLGAEINIEYDGDSYSKAILTNNASLEIDNFVADFANNRFTFHIQGLGYKVSDFFAAGDKVNLMMYRYVNYTQLSPCPYGIPPGTYPPNYYETLGRPQRDPSDYTGLTIYSIDDANDKMTVTYDPNTWFFGSTWQSGTCYNANFTMGYLGNLFKSNNRETFGGGIRVKSISVKNTSSNTISKTNYDYNIPGKSISSGVTSYEPGVLDVPAANDVNYKKTLYSNVNNLLKISREAPPPGVMYEYVTTTNSIINPDETIPYNMEGKNVYQFEVFNNNMLSKVDIDNNSTSPSNIAIRNYTTRIGNLRRVVSYDKNGRKLTETVNNYLHDGLEKLPFDQFSTQYNSLLANYNYQGVIMERFAQVKEVADGFNPGTPNRYIMSAREEYPNIQTGQTVFDYTTNTSTSTQDLAFDFYSGAVTKQLNVDANGNRFLTEITPAYLKYPNMGPRLNYSSYKNMLTQEAARNVFKVDATNFKTGLVSANVTTWSLTIPAVKSSNDNATMVQNVSGNAVWRKKATYAWLPEGTRAGNITPYSEFYIGDFNWDDPNTLSAGWKKTGETTLYDVYSKAVEGYDINGIYSAVKMGYNNSKVIMNGTPAKYNEIAYSGAEDNLVTGKFEGNVGSGNGVVSSAFAHTGTNSLKVLTGQTGFTYSAPVSQLQANRDYFVSVWAYSSSGAVPGGKIYYQRNAETPILSSAATVTKKAGSWYLLEFLIPASIVTAGSTLNVGIKNNGTVDEYYDDFRFAPNNASVTTYVYDKTTGELTYVLDNNNLYNRFEYDEAGRLKAKYRETFGVSAGVIKTVDYQYNYAQ